MLTRAALVRFMVEDEGVDDGTLVRRSGAGDPDALAELFRRHGDFVFRVALGLTGRRDDALDVVQETFLALWRQAATLDVERAKLTTWLYRVARNRALDLARRARLRDLFAPISPRATPPSPEQETLDAERVRRLHHVVRKLPRRAREAFVLRIGMEKSVEETAELMECSTGAVRTALHTAAKLLKAKLEDPGHETGLEPAGS